MYKMRLNSADFIKNLSNSRYRRLTLHTVHFNSGFMKYMRTVTPSAFTICMSAVPDHAVPHTALALNFN